VSKHPFTAILRAHILSVQKPQPRYIVRGSKGTYIKYGVDIQEEQLKAIAQPADIFAEGHGLEPQDLWGRIDNLREGNEIVSETYVSQ
jgi:hypothetical protein